jgi:hypothetical protein
MYYSHRNRVFVVILIVSLIVVTGVQHQMQYSFGQKATTPTLNSIVESSKATSNKAFLFVNSNVGWSATIVDPEGDSFTQNGSGDSSIEFECIPGFMNIYSLSVQKQTETGFLSIAIVQNGTILDKGETNATYGIAQLSGNCNEPQL